LEILARLKSFTEFHVCFKHHEKYQYFEFYILGKKIIFIWEINIVPNFCLGNFSGLLDLMVPYAFEILSVHGTFRYDCWFQWEPDIKYSRELKEIC
jgi:hypothetical protein